MTMMKIKRKVFFTGLALLALSVVLDARFANDIPSVTVPEPTSLSLLALGGVAAAVVSLIRRRK